MNTAKIDFQSGTGTPATGEIALPEGTAKAPCVVVVQEWWGINDHMRSIMTRLATEGFVVLAPDLYHGKVATNAEDAGAMMNALDWPLAIAEIGGAAEALRQHPRSNGKVAVMGFCMGGALSFASACALPGLSAVVPFYGVPSEADWSKVTAPILAHFAEKDGWAKPAAAKAILEKITAQGGTMSLYVYAADHAFFNDTRPEVYDADAAHLAWQRTISFLKTEMQA